jgi:hypothetical protein
MKTLAAIVLSSILFAASASAASINSKCNGKPTVTEWVSGQVEAFAKDGIQIDPVPMEGEALKKFIAALQDNLRQKGMDPAMFPTDWDLVVWAKLKDPSGNEAVGIAAFKNGCLDQSDVWGVEVFFQTMKKAFGVDA